MLGGGRLRLKPWPATHLSTCGGSRRWRAVRVVSWARAGRAAWFRRPPSCRVRRERPLRWQALAANISGRSRQWVSLCCDRVMERRAG